MELWLRPPTTAISVLKFCSCSSFWKANREEEALAYYPAALRREGAGLDGVWAHAEGGHLCHMHEVCDDQCPLRGCGFAEDHELDPLRDAVEEGDESLQDRIVYSAAMSHKAVIVLELGIGGVGLNALLASPITVLPCSSSRCHLMKPPNHPWEPAYPGALALSGTPFSAHPAPQPQAFRPHQDLAEGTILQVGKMFCQLHRLQVIKQQGHLALFLFHRVPLGHLPLPFVGGAGGAGVVSPVLEVSPASCDPTLTQACHSN